MALFDPHCVRLFEFLDIKVFTRLSAKNSGCKIFIAFLQQICDPMLYSLGLAQFGFTKERLFDLFPKKIIQLEVNVRRIRYQVACSLDGYIADLAGKTDWIVDEPTIDFDALFDQFDTLLMGRLTYEGLQKETNNFWGKTVLVCSQTLRQQDHPHVTIISNNIQATLNQMRSQPGKDIWLFGGGQLFQSLLSLGCVDTIEPAIIPVLLGGGRPLLPTPAAGHQLSLTSQRVLPSGIVWLEYTIKPVKESESPHM
ncbi:MAG TPA: dihydrofolate reductase family protein [Anaerolineaceae bacterium]|nr:dihydrofolate reductase family protein [Anaerolineaceae bacterium]